MGDHDYITITGWMVNNMKISGNDLLVYALIFGFSKDGKSVFDGGHKYICESIKASKPTVIKSLTFLIDRGFILKGQTVKDGVNYNNYRVDIEVVKKLYLGSKETLHNNIYTSLDSKLNSNNLRTREKKSEGESNIFYRSFKELSITKEEVTKLESLGYSLSQIDEVIDDIENFKGNGKYTSLYLTARKWLKKVKPDNEKKQLGIDDEYSRDNFFNFN